MAMSRSSFGVRGPLRPNLCPKDLHVVGLVGLRGAETPSSPLADLPRAGDACAYSLGLVALLESREQGDPQDMAVHSGYPKISGRVFRVSGISDFQK